LSSVGSKPNAKTLCEDEFVSLFLVVPLFYIENDSLSKVLFLLA